MREPIQLPLPIPGATVEIPLTQGQVAIVDVVDADLAEFKWCVHRGGVHRYAVRHIRKIRKGKKHVIRMHRVILERVIGKSLLSDQHVDHINGNSLDNRRINLRVATRAENMRNRRKHAHATSRYKGVYKKGNKWAARIRFNGKPEHLGTFDTSEDAARAYDKRAMVLHGEFARLNFEVEQE